VVAVRQSKDADALSHFEPESSEPAPRRDASDVDWLNAFGAEAAPEAPAEAVAGVSVAQRRIATSQQQRISVRWMAASAVVVLLSAVAAAWGVSALRVPVQEPQDVQPAASTPSPPGPSARVARELPRPSPAVAERTGAPASVPEALEPPAPPAGERIPERVNPTERASPPTAAGSESAIRPSADTGEEGVVRPSETVGSPQREPPLPAPPVLAGAPQMAEWSAPVVSEARHAPSHSEEVVVTAAESAEAAAEAERAAAVVSVRETLRAYQDAYERMDVAAAADVWPSVDRRTLSRAFDALRSQGLVFDSCAVSVTGAQATAHCRGALEIVRKVGSALPMIIEQEWVFTMQHIGAEWKIETVSASRLQDPE
jgi:hypothetical protein